MFANTEQIRMEAKLSKTRIEPMTSWTKSKPATLAKMKTVLQEFETASY